MSGPLRSSEGDRPCLRSLLHVPSEPVPRISLNGRLHLSHWHWQRKPLGENADWPIENNPIPPQRGRAFQSRHTDYRSDHILSPPRPRLAGVVGRESSTASWRAVEIPTTAVPCLTNRCPVGSAPGHSTIFWVWNISTSYPGSAYSRFAASGSSPSAKTSNLRPSFSF